MQKVKNFPARLKAIAVSHIIFDRSEWVSLWGFLPRSSGNRRMDFILTFDLLNKLLRLSGEQGDRIQMLLVDKLEGQVEEPTLIDLTAHFGKPIVFDACQLKVSPTGIQDGAGHWRTDPACLSIDDVAPLLQRTSPVLSPMAACQQNFSRCTELLAKLYALYLGYLEIGFDEQSALEKAELQDDLKFKMAYYTWQMQQAA